MSEAVQAVSEFVYETVGATVRRVTVADGYCWHVVEYMEDVTAECRNAWRQYVPSRALRGGYAGSSDVDATATRGYGILTKYFESK